MSGLRRQWSISILYGAIAIAALAGAACVADRIGSPRPEEISKVDGKPLDLSVMSDLRSRAEGCTFSLADRNTGGVRKIALRGKELPFALPPLKPDPKTGLFNGRPIATKVLAPDNSGDTISVRCLVPSSMGIGEFVSILAAGVPTRIWQGMYGVLRHTRLARPAGDAHAREYAELRYEYLDHSPPPLTFAGAPAAGAYRDVYTCVPVFASAASRSGANLNVSIVCTCAIFVNGYNCVMNFEGTDTSFWEDDDWDYTISWDPGGSNTGGDDSYTPEPPIYQFCDDSTDSLDESWIEPTIDQAEPDPVVCEGSGAKQCMSDNPGIWVGSWPIPATLGAAHHTAMNIIPPPQVTELVGWFETTTNIIERGKPDPHYGEGFQSYKWVKVGELYQASTINAALDKATKDYADKTYTLSSNRFIASALKYSNITLTKGQQKQIGLAPGICHCGNCK
jgi:hypothetical protein